jgi:cysteine synthase
MAESIRTTVVQIQDPAVDKFVGRSLSLFTTLEGENPGGSVKDHMALGALQKLLTDGILKAGMILTEASAGSTALSLAHYTKLKHVACTLFVPETHPVKSLEHLRSFGAEVRLVEVDGDANWQPYYDFLKEPGVLAFNQHLDASKRIFYHELGKKIIQKTGPVDAMIGAVGTAHSLLGAYEGMGCDPYLVTAEPRTEKVSGIRNIDTLRYGDEDPCTSDLFDERILLDASEFFPGDKIMTDHGPIRFADSFRVTLAGLSRLARSRPQMKSCFVLASTNRRES